MEKCCVCFRNNTNVRSIIGNDTNNYSAAYKLRSCISEIEWKESFMICSPCDTQLNAVYKFREKCLITEDLRHQQIIHSLAKTEDGTPYADFVEEHIQHEVIVPTMETKDDTEREKLGQSDEIEVPPKKTEAHKFSCEHCDLSFKSSSQLVTHSVKEHQCEARSVKPFSCDTCSSRFVNSTNLASHKKYHAKDRTFVCSYCGKSYKTINDLKVHEKIHQNKREYKCEQCLKSYNTHKNLRTHKLVVHTDPSLWNHVCQVCSKRFPIKSSYDAHMRRHNNERPFACHLCEKKFIDKCVLQKHFLTHTNHRDHVCHICKKEYKVKRILDLHQKRVHGIGDIRVPERVKKYLCHLCPKTYFAKNKLTRHLCTHTGERPHICLICQKKFVDKSYVKIHMKKAHHVEDE